jgi:hypothetical protein
MVAHSLTWAEHDGFVYFIHAPALEAVKIGWSANPVDRAKELAGQFHCHTTLLAAIPGTRLSETVEHERWAHLWHSREWFIECPSLLAYASAANSAIPAQSLPYRGVRPLERLHLGRPVGRGRRRWQQEVG